MDKNEFTKTKGCENQMWRKLEVTMMLIRENLTMKSKRVRVQRKTKETKKKK